MSCLRNWICPQIIGNYLLSRLYANFPVYLKCNTYYIFLLQIRIYLRFKHYTWLLHLLTKKRSYFCHGTDSSKSPDQFSVTSYLIFHICLVFCSLHRAASRILVPQPGISSWPLRWNQSVITGLPRKSLMVFFLCH